MISLEMKNRSSIQNRLIIQQLNTDKIKESNELGIIGFLKPGCLSFDKKKFLFFCLLPHLIAPKKAGKRRPEESKTEPIRLSMRERHESFIFHVKVYLEKIFFSYKSDGNFSQSDTPNSPGYMG
ncbi:hypothetical protein TKK_0010259 [Trichogramma kaykai]